MTAPDILAALQSLADENSELAEQLFRLATTVNYHTSVEIGRRLAKRETCTLNESYTKKREAR